MIRAEAVAPDVERFHDSNDETPVLSTYCATVTCSPSRPCATCLRERGFGCEMTSAHAGGPVPYADVVDAEGTALCGACAATLDAEDAAAKGGV